MLGSSAFWLPSPEVDTLGTFYFLAMYGPDPRAKEGFAAQSLGNQRRSFFIVIGFAANLYQPETAAEQMTRVLSPLLSARLSRMTAREEKKKRNGTSSGRLSNFLVPPARVPYD